MRKICAGTVRNRDKTWFSELSDKAVCVVIWKYKFTIFCHLARTTKVHLYWCMKNCDGDPDRLRAEHKQALSGVCMSVRGYVNFLIVYMCECMFLY